MLVDYLFCFFKQRTAYDVRISVWSSDVCSSDLMGDALGGEARHVRQKGDDVRRRQPGRSTLQRCRDAERADRRGVETRHPPQLARHFDGRGLAVRPRHRDAGRSEEHTSELQSLMRISYAVFCLKKKILIKTLYKTYDHKRLINN